MTRVLNLSEDLPATVTLQLYRFDGDTLVMMANCISNEIYELESEKPTHFEQLIDGQVKVFEENPFQTQRRANERMALHSLFTVLRNHISNLHGEAYLCQVVNPEEDVA